MKMLSPRMAIRYYMERMAAHAELPEHKVLQLMAILDINPGRYDDTRMDKILAVFDDEITYELLQSHAMRDVRTWEKILAN